ncbi:hypothetical protein ACIHCQ_31080 [Streptomyces sp. NPDC052236]|uniref:hypothetical protein n=1 Tax=Streptomyces sp. NPDC052236 TaxID=3365686 RepID=UPI0037D76822
MPADRGAAAALADAHVRPWWDHAVRADGERITRWNRAVHATPLPDSRGASSSSGCSGRPAAAASGDPVRWRYLARTQMSMPPTAFSPSGDEARRRVLAACEKTGPWTPPGPDRAHLLATGTAASRTATSRTAAKEGDLVTD